MNTTCEQYLENPEAHAAHLDECAECRELFATLEAPPSFDPIVMRALPMAPWEGAAHRSWGLVAIVALAVLALAVGLFAMAGIPPVRGLREALATTVPPVASVLDAANLAGGALQTAPLAWQIVIVVSFFAVNAVLFLLLRRAPKGLDV